MEDRKAVNKMTVLLVLGTFLVFIVLDYSLNRRKAIHTVSAEAPLAAAANSSAPMRTTFCRSRTNQPCPL